VRGRGGAGRGDDGTGEVPPLSGPLAQYCLLGGMFALCIYPLSAEETGPAATNANTFVPAYPNDCMKSMFDSLFIELIPPIDPEEYVNCELKCL
jgi:hypothetical protein